MIIKEEIKIFGFIGSPLKKRSNTYTLTKMMIDKLLEKNGDIEYTLLTSGDVNIKSCDGCWSCMTHGPCPLDKKDDMAFLKEKMLESELIIWGSPVYAMHVSGHMKAFLDRLANWYHTLRLAGKPGVTVSTTAGSGLEEVHQYLHLLFSVAGIKRIHSLDTYGTLPGTIVDPESASKSAEKAAYEIYPFINGEKRIKSDKWLEYSFQAMKDKVMNKGTLNADYEYWKENEMLKMNSFEELLQKKSMS